MVRVHWVGRQCGLLAGAPALTVWPTTPLEAGSTLLRRFHGHLAADVTGGEGFAGIENRLSLLADWLQVNPG